MADIPGLHTSVWMDTTPSTQYPSLKPNINVDVAILGGGIAGLSCAYFLKQAGKTVAVIEADHIVSGVTGFTTAHITSEHNFLYDYLIKTFGKEGAGLYADANETAIEKIAQIVKKEGIECDFKRVSQHFMTENKEDLDKLKQEYNAAKQLDLPVTFEDSAPAPFPNYGTIHYHNQAQFHPRKYLLALAKKIDGGGSFIFEKTRATDVKEGEPCIVKTEKGDLKAKDVIIATHFPFLDRGGYFARMKPMRSYVLGMYVKNKMEAVMFDNTANPYNYIRTQPTKKGTLVLVGGEDHTTGQVVDTMQCYRNLEAYARDRFDMQSIAYHWSTQDNYPFDQVPFIGTFMPTSQHLFVATGFQGYGMTFGTIAGVMLSDMIAGKHTKWESLLSPQRYKATKEVPATMKMGLGIVTNLINKLTPKAQQDINTVKPNSGKIIEVGGQKVAVYKDKKGNICTVSATCQHMGCAVAFNNAEQSWDCPCHGSRYSPDGAILHGPTIKKLPVF